MKIASTDVLLRPLMSEKSYVESSIDKYRFAVHPQANKIMIRKAVEELFEVKVVDVNVSTVPGKKKRFGRFEHQRPNWKKAVVTLAEGHTLDFFEQA